MPTAYAHVSANSTSRLAQIFLYLLGCSTLRRKEWINHHTLKIVTKTMLCLSHVCRLLLMNYHPFVSSSYFITSFFFLCRFILPKHDRLAWRGFLFSLALVLPHERHGYQHVVSHKPILCQSRVLKNNIFLYLFSLNWAWDAGVRLCSGKREIIYLFLSIARWILFYTDWTQVADFRYVPFVWGFFFFSCSERLSQNNSFFYQCHLTYVSVLWLSKGTAHIIHTYPGV